MRHILQSDYVLLAVFRREFTLSPNPLFDFAVRAKNPARNRYPAPMDFSFPNSSFTTRIVLPHPA